MVKPRRPRLLAEERDHTVFLVLDCQTHLQKLITDLRSGKYRYPLRVAAFNTEDGCLQDVSVDIARELLSRAGESDLPTAVRDFIRRSWSSGV